MTFDPTPRSLDSLAWRIAEHGIDTQLDDVRALASTARWAGVPEAMVAVMVDPQEPAVARLRAFGAVAAAVAGHHSSAAPPGFVVAA
jgi:hypothetical protein